MLAVASDLPEQPSKYCQRRRPTFVYLYILAGIVIPTVVVRYSTQLRSFAGGYEITEQASSCSLKRNCSSLSSTRFMKGSDEHAALLSRLSPLLSGNATEQLNPPHTPGVFIHLGKTGGSTLSFHLRNGCHSFVPKPCKHRKLQNESHMSKLTTYVHTPDIDKMGQGKWTFEFYAMSLRDPLERFLSAFVYMHPLNGMVVARKDYENGVYGCFPTVEDFAQKLGDDFDNHHAYNSSDIWEVDMSNCTLLARAILANRVKVDVPHFYFDFKYTARRIPSNASFLAIRNEFLWHDWVTANEWLGESNVPIFPTEKVRDFAAKKHEVSKDLSPEGRNRLCRALESEYQTYWELIKRAANLQLEEKIATFELSKQSCPELKPPSCAASDSESVERLRH